MHAVPIHPRYTPTSVGALMDPVFLRRAVNDMAADTTPSDAQVPLAPSTLDLIERCAARLAAAVAHLFVPAAR
jgi:hypothetical protein